MILKPIIQYTFFLIKLRFFRLQSSPGKHYNHFMACPATQLLNILYQQDLV